MRLRSITVILFDPRSAAVICLSGVLPLPAALARCPGTELHAPDPRQREGFGYSVAVTGDFLLVGAPGDDNGNPDVNVPPPGATHVFRRNGATWSRSARLVASDGQWPDAFGAAVSVDGPMAAIGAPQDFDNGEVSGSAYLFERDGVGGWEQVAKLLAKDGAEFDYFGRRVAIDGDIALVAAPEDNDRGVDTGSAYVFQRQPDGTWPQVQKLLADDRVSGAYFGDAISVSGQRVLIGARGDDSRGNNSGSAYVFERAANAQWVQVAKLVADDIGSFFAFGNAVALAGDVALVGCTASDGRVAATGAVYVFERQADGTWRQVRKLFADDGQNSDAFGYAVAMHGDVAVVGAPSDDDQGRSSGSAYVFHRRGDGSWRQVAKLRAEEVDTDDFFGSAVAVHGNTAVIGAWQDDDHGIYSGAAYVFAVGPDEDGDGTMDACECLAADLDDDGVVNLTDLGILLRDFGCHATGCSGDIDGNGYTDLVDVQLLLEVFGRTCLE